jgi:hypothetical protein
MSATYIDDDLLSQPLNGLVSSKEIMNQQLNALTGTKTLTAVDLDQDQFRAVPADLTPEQKRVYDLKLTVGEGAESTPVMSAASQPVTTQYYYDGPKRTGQSLKTVAEQYGLPMSVRETIDDAQDAVLGISRDLTQQSTEKKSFYEILTQDNRLRGIGALLVITAIVAFIVKILAGT